MSEKNSNGILKTTAVIAESFRNKNITDDNILELLDNQMFINLLDSVPDSDSRERLFTSCPVFFCWFF